MAGRACWAPRVRRSTFLERSTFACNESLEARSRPMPADNVIDLKLVPSFCLDQNGKLKPEVKKDGTLGSKYSNEELNDLIPIGRRYGVRAPAHMT